MNRKVAQAPFAEGSDGTVSVNLAHVRGDIAVAKLIRQARRMDGVLFLGISVSRPAKVVLIQAIDNAGAKSIAKMVGRRSSSRGSR